MPAGAPLGNKNATKSKPWSEAIAKFAKQNPNKRDKVIEKLYEQAISGDLPAIKEIIDRTEGKATQGLEISGSDGGPVQWEFLGKPPSGKRDE